MAEENKKSPGRSSGSKNTSGSGNSGRGSSGRTSDAKDARTPEEIRQERIAKMQAEYDRDRRNIDVIWSITLIALGLFLFFTVVMDSTGTFGSKVHDVCMGMFGLMAYALPFMILICALLLLTGRMQHFSARTAVFSILIYFNICILNSYRFIDEKNINVF